MVFLSWITGEYSDLLPEPAGSRFVHSCPRLTTGEEMVQFKCLCDFSEYNHTHAQQLQPLHLETRSDSFLATVMDDGIAVLSTHFAREDASSEWIFQRSIMANSTWSLSMVVPGVHA